MVLLACNVLLDLELRSYVKYGVALQRGGEPNHLESKLHVCPIHTILILNPSRYIIDVVELSDALTTRL